MFTHIMVGANDPEKSVAFYNAALGELGIPAGQPTPVGAFYSHNGGAFGVGAPRDGNAATFANGGTIGFRAETKEQVDAFSFRRHRKWRNMRGGPGQRGDGDNYGAYLRDPDGNKICAFWSAGQ